MKVDETALPVESRLETPVHATSSAAPEAQVGGVHEFEVHLAAHRPDVGPAEAQVLRRLVPIPPHDGQRILNAVACKGQGAAPRHYGCESGSRAIHEERLEVASAELQARAGRHQNV